MRFPLLGLLAVVGACNNLRSDDAVIGDGGLPTDASVDSATDADSDALPLRDAGTSDTGGPLPDTECGDANAWKLPNKTDKACVGRQVVMMANWVTSPTTRVDGLDMATSPLGRLGVVVSRETGPEEGTLDVFVFPGGHPELVNKLQLTAGAFVKAGTSAAITALPAEAFYVASEEDQNDSGGPVYLRKLQPNGAAYAFGNPQLVGTGRRFGALSVAYSNLDASTLVTYMTESASSGSLTSRILDANGTFLTPRDIKSSFPIGNRAGSGENIVRYFPALRQFHVAFQCGIGNTSSVLQTAYFDAGGWKDLTTLDEPTAQYWVGTSPAIAAINEQLVFAYYNHISTANIAELHLTRWLRPAQPVVELRRGQLPTLTPNHVNHVSLATDGFGLVHMISAELDAVSANPTCSIRYSRQDGHGSWLNDSVALGIPCDASNELRVALQVEPNGRPHMVFASASTGLFYATRSDR